MRTRVGWTIARDVMAKLVGLSRSPRWAVSLRMGFYVMNNRWGDISGVDPLRSIDLVWTLRDIKAKRTLLPVDPDHLRELIDLGLVEMREDVPVLTNAGHQVLD
jgi:hypothetical protein